MSDVDVLPELKEIVGAVLFAAKQPVTLDQLAELFPQTADQHGGIAKDYASATRADVEAALAAFRADLERARLGLSVVEVAGGFRLENRAACGPWLRQYLDKGRPNRLSRPAMETLAIIAYRQPVMRSEIESVRGVAVDQILRNLLDLQLIRIAGRSELPGRPWLFGTTQKFLEQFGLRSLDDLPGVEELRRIEETRGAAPSPAPAAAAEPSAPVVGFAGGPVAAAVENEEPPAAGAPDAPPAPREDDFVIDDTEDEFDDEDDDETDFDDDEDRDFEEEGGESADDGPGTPDRPEDRP